VSLSLQPIIVALLLVIDLFCCAAPGEDVLSLDVSFIDRSWTYRVFNIGLVHCKEGTSGAQVADAIRPALDKHELRGRIFAYVKDQGSNLKTTAQALSRGFDMSENVCCKAIGQSKPFVGVYLCHPNCILYNFLCKF
jgi:hypothetical protein